MFQEAIDFIVPIKKNYLWFLFLSYICRVPDAGLLHLPPGRSLLLLLQPCPLWFPQPEFFQCLPPVISPAMGKKGQVEYSQQLASS